ncbi:hypothetical protein ACDZ28_33245 (plasmid) [Paenibacillus sp. RS8]|uniref:hypothetical protein n=1 Tax=Paenibacillus sp. RS8 TaxID=3242681 RepID=UPI0035C25E41
MANFDIGSCDFCYEDNRILKRHYDKWGDHILDSCMHGCDSQLSDANRLSRGLWFSVLELKRLEVSYIDSLWHVICVDSQGKQFDRRLRRFNSESPESLKRAIEDCTSYIELSKLQLSIHYD